MIKHKSAKAELTPKLHQFFYPQLKNSQSKIPPLIQIVPQTPPPRQPSHHSPIQTLNNSQIQTQYMFEKIEKIELVQKSVPEVLQHEEVENKNFSQRHSFQIIPIQNQDQDQLQEQKAIQEEEAKEEEGRDDMVDSLEMQPSIELEILALSQLTMAEKLYNNIVKDPLKIDPYEYQQIVIGEMGWKTKPNNELVSSLLTNPTKLSIYIQNLFNQIVDNNKAKTTNDIHGQQVEPFNSRLEEVYSLLTCLLLKLTNKKKKGKKSVVKKREEEGKTEVILKEKGFRICIDSQAESTKKDNANKIFKLKQHIKEKDKEMIDVKKFYEGIVQNYALSIENFSKHQSPPDSPLEENLVRKKNHTFGARQSSKNIQ